MKDNEKKDGVYIVKDGKTKKVTPPASGFGKQVVFWENGKPTRSEVSFTEKA